MCTAHAAHRQRHTSSVCAHTPAGSLGPAGCCTPTHTPTPTFPQPGHGHPLPSQPPTLPRGRGSCLRCRSRLPGPPSTGAGATGARLVLLPLRCLAPVLSGSRLPAVRDHPTDARARPILGTAAGNPDGEKSWSPCGIGVGRVCVECGCPCPALPVLGYPSTARLSGWRGVPCPGGGLKGGSVPGVQVCHKEPREESSPGPDPLCRIPQRRATL